MGSWVKLVVAPNDIEAHLLTGVLNEVGIETFTVQDATAPGAWLLAGSNPWAPVEVMIPEGTIDEARLVLSELELTSAAGEAVRHRPSALWLVTAIALSALFTALVLAQLARGNIACQLPILCTGSAITQEGM